MKLSKKLETTKVLNYFFQLLFTILRQNNKKFIFTSSPDFSDNAFAFFIYLDQNYVFKPVWLIDNIDEIEKYKKIIKNYAIKNEVLFIKKKSLSGFYHYLTAKFVFSTHGLYRKFGRIKGHNTINLWHGMPIKNIENLDRNNNSIPDSSNMYIVTSKFYQEKFTKIFNVESSSIFVTGLPRNDFLVNGKADIKKILGINRNTNKVIMWMPTFRKTNNQLDNIFSVKNISSLNSYLDLNNSFCIIKKHPLDSTDLSHLNSFERIKIIDDTILEFEKTYFYEFFNSVDILLTDFSSIYIDFLLLNKPIGFFVPDIESYNYSRGFLFKNIEDIMPGEILTNMNDLIRFLELIIINNNDMYIEKRKKLKDLFHDVDNNFSQNLTRKIF